MKNLWPIFLCLIFTACRPNPEMENKSGYNDFIYLSFINNENVFYEKKEPQILLDSNEEEIAKVLIKSTWIWLLNKDTSDFASNLILYKTFKNDTDFNHHYESIIDWKRYQKKEDILYWDSVLKKPKR